MNCGFVKDLVIRDGKDVTFTLELTTPACPVKEEFDRQSRAFISEIDWVESVNLVMTARPAEEMNDMPDSGSRASGGPATSSPSPRAKAASGSPPPA